MYSYNMITAKKFLKENKEAIGKLTSTEKNVFFYLCDFANNLGTCYPKVKTLADVVTCSKRGVQNALKTLLLKGLITRNAQYDFKTGMQKCNYYTINLDIQKLNEIATQNEKQIRKEQDLRAYRQRKNQVIKERIILKEERLKKEHEEQENKIKAIKCEIKEQFKKDKANHQRKQKKARKVKLEGMKRVYLIMRYANLLKEELLLKNLNFKNSNLQVKRVKLEASINNDMVNEKNEFECGEKIRIYKKRYWLNKVGYFRIIKDIREIKSHILKTVIYKNYSRTQKNSKKIVA